MNQADVTRLVSKLRFNIRIRHRKLKTIKGPEYRLQRMANIVTGLFKYERLELNSHVADEARGYAERLISDAIRHGDTHAETMEYANYYILEKQYIHKLFKVIVPRFRDYQVSYTRMYKAPGHFPGTGKTRAVLELRGHPFPPLKPDMNSNRNLIHNILLAGARKEYRLEKYEKLAADGESNSDGDIGGKLRLDENEEDELSEQLKNTKIDESTERKE